MEHLIARMNIIKNHREDTEHLLKNIKNTNVLMNDIENHLNK